MTPTILCLGLAVCAWQASLPAGAESQNAANEPDWKWKMLASHHTGPPRPLAFEPNVGQTNASVRFVTRTSGASFYFTPGEVVISLAMDSKTPYGRNPPLISALGEAPPLVSTARLQFLDANPSATVEPGRALPGRINYLLGASPARWRTGIPTFSGVTYARLYPGVDLSFAGTRGGMKGTYTVAPGADPSRIRWRYQGGPSVHMNRAGGLLVRLETSPGDLGANPAPTLTEHAPVAWQEIDQVRRPVPVRYAIGDDGSIGFELGNYDRSHPLTIDPTLTYSTYLGGSGDDYCADIALDDAGYIYVTGATASLDFPQKNAVQTTNQGLFDAWVAKLSPDGSELIFATYLGGAVFFPGSSFDADAGEGIAVDGAGNVYVAGSTNSTDFPTVNAYQPAYAGGYGDAWVAKLNPEGSTLLYSTYLGGTYASADYATDIGVDGAGQAYVVGVTGSPNFPTVNPIQPHRGSEDAFICKFNPAGSTLVYSTTIGGGAGDYATAMALDAAGAVYIAGTTGSLDYPVFNPVPGVGSPGVFADVIVSKLNPAGSLLEYSTYLGGLSHDFGTGIAVDPGGNAYVTGWTVSDNFPTLLPFQPTLGGGSDAFVSKISPVGLTLLYSTYLGGTDNDIGGAITVDAAGRAYVTGRAFSINFPVANAIQPVKSGGADAFLTQFNETGLELVQSTFLGGAGGSEEGTAVILDGADGVYVAGLARGGGFPTVDPFQPAYGGGLVDAFIARISATAADLSVTKTDSPDPAVVSEPLTYTATVTNHGPDGAAAVTVTDTLPGSVTFDSATPSQGSCNESGGVVTCDLGTLAASASATVEIVVTPTEAGTLSNMAWVRSATTDPARANGSDAEDTGVESSTTAVGEQLPTLRLALDGLGQNPISGPLKISFTLPSSAPARLTLMDVAGRAVLAREVGWFGPGHHVLDLGSGAEIRPGVYLVGLTQGREVRTLKAAVIH